MLHGAKIQKSVIYIAQTPNFTDFIEEDRYHHNTV